MKRMFFAMLAFVIIVYSCSCNKANLSEANCSGPKAALDSTPLLAFAKKNNITPVADTSWLYYQVITQGSGSAPLGNSKVYVRYVARFMDGTYLDSAGTATRFALDSLIKGWQYGLPKIQVGGRIKLLVPSALAYGCKGTTYIPANSPLYFDIYLDSLK